MTSLSASPRWAATYVALFSLLAAGPMLVFSVNTGSNSNVHTESISVTSTGNVEDYEKDQGMMRRVLGRKSSLDNVALQENQKIDKPDAEDLVEPADSDTALAAFSDPALQRMKTKDPGLAAKYDTTSLCGRSCLQAVAVEKAPCEAIFSSGCRGDAPPGFTKDSTLYDLCPIACGERPDEGSTMVSMALILGLAAICMIMVCLGCAKGTGLIQGKGLDSWWTMVSGSAFMSSTRFSSHTASGFQEFEDEYDENQDVNQNEPEPESTEWAIGGDASLYGTGPLATGGQSASIMGSAMSMSSPPAIDAKDSEEKFKASNERYKAEQADKAKQAALVAASEERYKASNAKYKADMEAAEKQAAEVRKASEDTYAASNAKFRAEQAQKAAEKKTAAAAAAAEKKTAAAAAAVEPQPTVLMDSEPTFVAEATMMTDATTVLGMATTMMDATTVLGMETVAMDTDVTMMMPDATVVLDQTVQFDDSMTVQAVESQASEGGGEPAQPPGGWL